jgi:hypothetical protein
MKVSLRKARQIRDDVEKLIAGQAVSPQLTLNVLADGHKELVASKRLEAMAQVKLLGDLDIAMFEIRKAIGRANAESGIADLLADRARCERLQARMAEVARTFSLADDASVLERRIEMNRTKLTSSDSRYVSETITVSVLKEEDAAFFAEAEITARRAIRDLDDRILELNVRTSIELSEASAELLKNHGII